MSIVLFEDSGVESLAPITTGRLACAVSCGSLRLIDLIANLQQPLIGITRAYMHAIQRADFAQLRLLDDVSLVATDRPKLMVNSRLVPSLAQIDLLTELLRSSDGSTAIVWDRDQIAAIVNPPWSHAQLKQVGHEGLSQLLSTARDFHSLPLGLKVLVWPHEVIATHMAIIGSNLEYRLRAGGFAEKSSGVFLAEGAKLGDYLVCDTKGGPIVIDRDAQIGPYTLLRGPLYIGPKSRVLEHAAIKDAVSVGHTTKIGGEVEASIVEPYSNKQHHGFLGHSYLGSWINLGAGTCNSDLKNTYGTVNMEYPAGRATTGMQFLGCVVGDYSKTAINTGIFTGKVIGVCSMMYGFVTSNVPSFVNYARLFGQMTTLPPEIMVATQQRMFARRNVQQRACDIQLIHDMYQGTQLERDRFGDAISL